MVCEIGFAPMMSWILAFLVQDQLFAGTAVPSEVLGQFWPWLVNRCDEARWVYASNVFLQISRWFPNDFKMILRWFQCLECNQNILDLFHSSTHGWRVCLLRSLRDMSKGGGSSFPTDLGQCISLSVFIWKTTLPWLFDGKAFCPCFFFQGFYPRGPAGLSNGRIQSLETSWKSWGTWLGQGPGKHLEQLISSLVLTQVAFVWNTGFGGPTPKGPCSAFDIGDTLDTSQDVLRCPQFVEQEICLATGARHCI